MTAYVLVLLSCGLSDLSQAPSRLFKRKTETSKTVFIDAIANETR